MKTILSSKQKEAKPNDDKSVQVNKQDDDKSDNQADNKLKEYGDNISEFSDFNTEEQGHVRLYRTSAL
uniref:Lipoprotein n=1 Tax=Strongyloides venezuelensis TaxID=75913 RepID=A0A0K0FRS5_STRVS